MMGILSELDKICLIGGLCVGFLEELLFDCVELMKITCFLKEFLLGWVKTAEGKLFTYTVRGKPKLKLLKNSILLKQFQNFVSRFQKRINNKLNFPNYFREFFITLVNINDTETLQGVISIIIVKDRSKSVSYRVMESLNYRTDLSLSEIRIYQNQVKGFEGEQCFDEIMTFHNPRGFVINDLLIGTQETFYQIDSLLITSDHIYLYEVKNYSGSYYYKDGVIHSKIRA